MHKWTPLLGGCAVGLLALAACSPPASNPPAGSQPPASSSSSVSTNAPQPSSPAPASTAVGVPTPSALATDALSNVICEPDAAGSWSFSGTLTNAGSSEVKFTVAVAVGVTSSPAGHAMIEQVVAPGATATVRADNFASAAPAGAQCEAVVSK
jgi:hypothetical protein